MKKKKEKYYFDTSIWRDHYENRFGQRGRPLGHYATKLFMRVIKNKHILLISDLVVREMKINHNEKEISNMLNFLFLANILQKTNISENNYKEAEKIAKERKVPTADCLHALIARENHAILISQDKHFQKVKDIVEVKKPEEII